MANVGVTFDFAAESAKLRSEIDKVRKEVGSISSTVKGVEEGFRSLGKVVAGAFSIGAITAFFAKVNSAADQLNDLSDRLGASASGLQSIQLAATLAGGSAEAAATALGKMTSVIGDAMAGNKQAVAAFDHLGLSISELSKLKADEAFRKIADAVANIPNAYERASVAQDIFGKGAKDIAGLLGQGGAALDEVNAQLAEQGALLDDLDVKKIGVMNDELTFQETVVTNLGAKFLSGLTPAVGVATNALSEMLGSLGGATDAGKTFGTVMVAAIKMIEAAVYGLASVFETVRELVAGLLSVISGGVSNLLSGFSTMAGAVGFDGLAGKLGSASDFMRDMDITLSDIAKSASQNADKATAAAIKAGAEVLNASAIFDQYEAKLNAQAAAAAARNAAMQGAGTGYQTPGGAGGAAGKTAKEKTPPISLEASGTHYAQAQMLENLDPKMDPRVILEGQIQDEILAVRAQYNATALGMLDSFNSSVLGSVFTNAQAQIDVERYKTMTVGEITQDAVGAALSGFAGLGKIGKAFSIAQTIWSTATAITKALAEVPYPANIAAAAAIAAKGAVQLATIKKTNIGSSGSIASPGGAAGSVGSTALSSSIPSPSTESQQKNAVQIIVNGSLFAAQETVDWLVEKIGDAVNNRDVVFINGSSRQAMELTA